MPEILPASGTYIGDTEVQLYQDSITALISDLGRKILLHLKPQEIECFNCQYDALNKRSAGIYTQTASGIEFPRGATCSVCNGRGVLFLPQNTIYTALVRRAPKELEYEVYGVDPATVLRTRTVLSSLSDIRECEFMVLNDQKYIKLMEPYLTGLRDEAYVLGTWRRIAP